MRSAFLPVLRRTQNLALAPGQSPLAYVQRSTGNSMMARILGGSGGQEQLRTYGSIPAVHACVSELAEATAQVEWKLYRKAASGNEEDRETVTDHAAIDLWDNPNPFMDRTFFIEFVQMHLDLVGEAYIIIGTDRRTGGLPMSLWPAIPTMMEPVTDASVFLKGYVYTDPDGVKVPFLPEEVIHLRYPDPENPYKGLSVVGALLPDLDADRYATEWNRNFFLYSAEPGGIIEMEDAISDDEFTELRDRWDEQHRGTGNAHRVAILTNGMKWVNRSFSMRDLEFSSLRSASDQRIMLGFKMGKTLLGQTEGVNRATAEAAEYVFGKYRIVRRLNRFKRMWNTVLLPRFVGGETLEWCYESPVTENYEEENAERDSRVAAATAFIDRGFDPAEVLAAFELPAFNLLPAEEAPALPVGGEPLGPREQAELVQKVYLGVGTVVTWEEARALLREAGMDLADIPEPEKAPAPAPPGLEAAPAPGTEGAAAALALLRRPALGSGHHHHHPAPARQRRAEDPPASLPPEDLPDVTPLQAKFDEVMDQLLADVAAAEDAQKRDLVSQVYELASQGSIADLADLSVETETTAAAIGAAMGVVGDHAAEAVVEEARTQGVTIQPREANHQQILDVASVVAVLLASRLIGSAAASAMRANASASSPAEVATYVQEQLSLLSPDTPRTTLGGALTGTQNEARIETLRKAPEGAIYAVEVNDANTCAPCRAVDGKWLGNISDLDAITELYPGGAYGGYIKCLGRERCRGTICGVWRQGA